MVEIQKTKNGHFSWAWFQPNPFKPSSSADQSPWKTTCHRQRPPRLYLSEKNQLVPSNKADVVLKGLAPQMWKVSGEKLSFSGNSVENLKIHWLKITFSLSKSPLYYSKSIEAFTFLHFSDPPIFNQGCLWWRIHRIWGTWALASRNVMPWNTGCSSSWMTKKHNILDSRTPYNHRPGFWTLIK